VGGDFSGVYNEGEGAAGTISASVTLTKIDAGSCTLKGWPLLTLQDTTGAVLTSSIIDERAGRRAHHSSPGPSQQAPTLLNPGEGGRRSISRWPTPTYRPVARLSVGAHAQRAGRQERFTTAT
jgi:hypothetical protein